WSLHPALIDALGGTELDVETRSALIERSGGNPLYLEELMSIVREGRDTNALPAGLHGLVSARLDRLAFAERAMLENAAILGLSGNSSTLIEMGAVLGQNPSMEVLLRLGAEDLLQINGDRWTFRSALVREVAYGRLTKSVRAIRHLEIAQAIEGLAAERDDRAELIGSHYAAAAELSADVSVDMPADLSARAVHWLRVASENASRRHLNGVALRLGLRALALVPLDAANRSDMVLLCGWLAAYARDAVSARNMVEQLNADPALSPGTTAGARCLEGIVEQLNGDLDRAVELFEDTIERTDALPDATELRAAALRWLGTTHMMRGEHELARDVLLQAISVYDAIGSAGGRAWALENLAWVAFAAGDLESADRLLADAAAAADQINDIGGRSAVEGIAGFVDCRRGRYADARIRAGGVLADAKLRGDRRQIAAMEQLLALVENADGQLESAIEHAQRSIAICRDLHEHYREGISLAALCRAELGRGRLTEIGANLERLQALTRTHHTRDLAAQTATQLAVLGGAPERVTGGVLEAAAAGVVTLVLFHLQRGEVDEALAATDTARPSTAADVHALEAVRALVLVNAGRYVDAISTASAAVDARDARAFERLLASIAVVIAHARLGDADSLRVAILAVRKEIEATDDLLAAALGLIAEAAADSLLAPESEKAKRTEAVTALRDLRLGPQAWLRATSA
ncbi:MAG: tetratricopeptide repeat protein, partial [Acidimicrobiia bacterium]